MSTSEAPNSADTLLRAVAEVPTPELETFVERVLVLRAQRTAPRLDHRETALLLQINRPFPEDRQRRYDQLVAKRRDGMLGPNELQELLQLTEQSEQHDGTRLAALIALAQARGVTVSALMTTLGIAARSDV